MLDEDVHDHWLFVLFLPSARMASAAWRSIEGDEEREQEGDIKHHWIFLITWKINPLSTGSLNKIQISSSHDR